MTLRRILAAAVAVVAFGACGGDGAGTDTAPVLTTMVAPDATPVASPDEAVETIASDSASAADSTSASDVSAPTFEQFSELPAISVDDLPDEAIEVLFLIDEGGPFPYDQDGSTFQNRERLLPQQARGHYREYTVETPGSYDRGARRIVAGDDGELYWTDDHYDSFSEIVDWGGGS